MMAAQQRGHHPRRRSSAALPPGIGADYYREMASLRPELNLYRLADRLHGRQIELDFDGDGLASQLFGHSP
jgi:hypothetical protein